MKKIAAALDALLPSIRERRAEIEKARRLPPDLATSLQATGVFSLPVPKALGGVEAPPADIMRVVETLSSADGSTGWTTMVGMGIFAGLMNELGAKEVFGDPTAPVAGVPGPLGQAVRVDGGVRVTGRWSPASGIDHSDWVYGGCIVHADGAPVMTDHGPDLLHVFIPKSSVTVNDTWYASGLAGTGSNEFIATDVFVPEHLIWNLFDPSGHRSEPLYRMPVIASFTSLVAAVGLGIARTALDEVTALAATRVPPLSIEPLANKPYAHVEIGHAEVALRSARSFLYDIVGETWELVAKGKPYTPRQNALNRAAAVNAVETAARVAQVASRLGGATALYASSSLQRHARDAEALTHHFVQSPDVWEQTGKVFLDRPTTVPLF